MGLKMLSRTFLLLLLLHSFQTKFVQEKQKNKISSVLSPRSYVLNLQLFPDEDRFEGEVAISVTWLKSTNTITLNVHKNLTVENTEVVLAKSETTGIKEQKIKIQKTKKIDEGNLYNIVLEERLNPGAECEVKIKFSGKLNTETTKGLFKKTYVDSVTGKSRWIIASNFKPNFTSSAFPCFDDPSFKTSFDVSIKRPAKMNSLSTMPLIQSEDLGSGWVKDIFLSSPPMAAYSLALFVSDLTPLTYNRQGVQIRIWPAPEIQHSIEYNRSEMLYKSLEVCGEYFGVKYPLSKLDYVIFPDSMGVNVYNSWGLIISSNNRTFDTVFEENYSISSEILSQWIGGLVTPSSWSDDDAALALASPRNIFNITKSSTNDQNSEYLLTELYANYYELLNPKPQTSPDIVRSVIDTKATMVHRMLAYTLSQNTFLEGIRKFMKDRQFKTFQLDDLWKTLTEQAHEDGTLPNNLTVKDIVTSWLTNYRLPYVTVNRNYEDNSALLLQRIFLRKRPKYLVKDDETLWTIPIVVVPQTTLDFTNTKPSVWMTKRELEIRNIGNSNQFIIVNPEEIGTYMVNYDTTNWNMLAQFLQSGEERNKIPVITRAKLIHDALNLAYGGCLDFATALNMTVYLKDEREYIAWHPFFIMFDHIGRHIDGTKAHEKYKTFVQLLIKPVYDQLSSNVESHDKMTAELYSAMKGNLNRAGCESAIKEASVAYNKWMNDNSKETEAVSKYFCTIFRYGTKGQWEFGFKTLLKMSEAPVNMERNYLFKTLAGCAEESWKIEKILNAAIFEHKNAFNDDDIKYVLVMLTGGASGYKSTFDYLQNNWIALKTSLQNKPEVWHQLIYTATRLFKDQEGLDKVSAFYSKHRGEFGSAETTIEDSLKTIKEEVQWTKENLSTLEEWLDDFIERHSI